MRSVSLSPLWYTHLETQRFNHFPFNTGQQSTILSIEISSEMDDADDADVEQNQVMSKVHLGCPPGTSGPHICLFTITIPPDVENARGRRFFRDKIPLQLDQDGDLILTRRISLMCRVIIQHNITSSIPNVWKAELVLSDFVLHKIFTSATFDGIISVELGAGTDKDADYDVLVSGVEISPYPVIRGHPTTFSLSANTGVPISGGKLAIDVSYFGWGIQCESHDFCEETSCPVSSGDFVLAHTQVLPGYTSPVTVPEHVNANGEQIVIPASQA